MGLRGRCARPPRRRAGRSSRSGIGAPSRARARPAPGRGRTGGPPARGSRSTARTGPGTARPSAAGRRALRSSRISGCHWKASASAASLVRLRRRTRRSTAAARRRPPPPAARSPAAERAEGRLTIRAVLENAQHAGTSPAARARSCRTGLSGQHGLAERERLGVPARVPLLDRHALRRGVDHQPAAHVDAGVVDLGDQRRAPARRAEQQDVAGARARPASGAASASSCAPSRTSCGRRPSSACPSERPDRGSSRARRGRSSRSRRGAWPIALSLVPPQT